MNYFNFSGFNSVEVLKYQIDDRDLHLISYIYTIQGKDNMEFINENGKVYYWLKNEKIIEDNPTLYAKTRTLNTMISNLCEKGLIEKIVRCQEKTTFKKTYYRITDKTRKMMFSLSDNNDFVLQSNETNITTCNTPAKTISRFVKPTIEELKEYCLQQGLDKVDCQKFYDYYESNGWKVGKNPMKDWKATLRNWQRTATNNNTNKPSEKGEWDFVTKAIRENNNTPYEYNEEDINF